MAGPNSSVAVEAVIEAVKQQLRDAADVAPSLRLTTFDLELECTVEKEAGGGFAIKVPVFGTIGGSGSAKTVTTTKVALSYKAPAPSHAKMEIQQMPEGIAAALATLESSIKAGLSSPPQLTFTGGDIEIAFGVKLQAGAKVEIFVLEASGSQSREDAHTVKLHFAPRES